MKNVFLLISFSISLALHLVFYLSFITIAEQRHTLRRPSSQLVAVISKPKPKAEPVKPQVEKKIPEPAQRPLPKPKIKKQVEKPRKKMPLQKKPKQASVKPKPEPPPNVQPDTEAQKDTPEAPAGLVPDNRIPPEGLPSATPVKPVFGVTPNSVQPGKGSGMSVRIGNTLLKKQEADFTSPEEVREPATDPAWETGTIVPAYELSTMALFKKKVQPEYPELLQEEEIEGNVHLTVVVNRFGNVVDIKVKSSDHELMTAAAIKAIKQFVFTPATVNGVPVASTIDDVPFIFVLDE
jgi:TonB family protein